MGEIGEDPGKGGHRQTEEGTAVTSVVWQEPGKGLRSACGFDFMINVHSLELWG